MSLRLLSKKKQTEREINRKVSTIPQRDVQRVKPSLQEKFRLEYRNSCFLEVVLLTERAADC